MPSQWYRCRAEVGDGGYVSYLGPDLWEALCAMDQHPYAQTVVVERMGHEGQWDFVVAGIWRPKKERANGAIRETRGVSTDVAGAGVGVGVGQPQQDTRRG